MKIELLPVARWGELRKAYEDCRSDDPLPLPKPEQSIMIAAFDGDRIVGCVGAERTWQVSPIWIEKELRGNGLAATLASEIKKYNTEGLAEMLVTTNKHVELLVCQIGFIPIPGTIWRR